MGSKKLNFYEESNPVHPVCNPSFYRLKLYTFAQKEASERAAFESYANVHFQNYYTNVIIAGNPHLHSIC
jgi:hypothetical protein